MSMRYRYVRIMDEDEICQIGFHLILLSLLYAPGIYAPGSYMSDMHHLYLHLHLHLAIIAP